MSVELEQIKTLSGHIAEGLEAADSTKSFVTILSEANEKQNNIQLRDVFQDVVADVAIGYPFSTALSKYPSTFNAPFIAAVRQGEVTGTMDETLRRFAGRELTAA